jgi:hypothetical protein
MTDDALVRFSEPSALPGAEKTTFTTFGDRNGGTRFIGPGEWNLLRERIENLALIERLRAKRAPRLADADILEYRLRSREHWTLRPAPDDPLRWQRGTRRLVPAVPQDLQQAA